MPMVHSRYQCPGWAHVPRETDRKREPLGGRRGDVRNPRSTVRKSAKSEASERVETDRCALGPDLPTQWAG
jgi:hypothetical protein